MSAEGIGALERGYRQVPYHATVALLAKALALSPVDAAELQEAATRVSRPRRRSAAPVEDRERHNLPAAPTRYLGREAELAELRALVAAERLVTVTGAGGVGKTRTALEIGSELIEDTTDGVWFVDLASISEGAAPADAPAFASMSQESLVVAAIAGVFGLTESSKTPLHETLRAYLARRTITIILDNCEHVIGAAAATAEALLRTCPQVRMVATSREPLRIAGERSYRLPSLHVPSEAASSQLSAEEAAGYAAIELFTQRGQVARPNFRLTAENVPAVAEVCRRLDGIPLAIELAAARLNVLSVHALANRLEARFAILMGGARTSLPRHQTMRALIDWSYELLTPAEQLVFERCSIFAGGFDLAAAAAVHADDAAESDVLGLLASLIDKSLVVADLTDVVDREPRYRLLESMRQYAREKLTARGESELVAQRHAWFFAARAEQLEDDNLVSAGMDIEEAKADLDDWRSALDWSLRARGDVVVGQRIAGALRPLWQRVSFVEGRRWLSAAFELVDERTPSRVRAMLDLGLAAIASNLGERERTIVHGECAVVAFDVLDDPLRAALARQKVAFAFLETGRALQAAPLLNEALSAARTHADARLTALILEMLVHERSKNGDIVSAREYAAEAASLWSAIGLKAYAAQMGYALGLAEFAAGNVERAITLATQALAAIRRDGNVHEHLLKLQLISFSAYLIADGRWDQARAAAREALTLQRETQRFAPPWELQCLAAVAVVSATATERDPARFRDAALVVGYVDGRAVALGSPRGYIETQEYDRICTTLRSVLGTAELAMLLKRGSALTHDDAVRIAMSW
jgi:predicted ATPase